MVRRPFIVPTTLSQRGGHSAVSSSEPNWRAQAKSPAQPSADSNHSAAEEFGASELTPAQGSRNAHDANSSKGEFASILAPLRDSTLVGTERKKKVAVQVGSFATGRKELRSCGSLQFHCNLPRCVLVGVARQPPRFPRHRTVENERQRTLRILRRAGGEQGLTRTLA